MASSLHCWDPRHIYATDAHSAVPLHSAMASVHHLRHLHGSHMLPPGLMSCLLQVNRNINYTNVCTYKCGFCAFRCAL